MSASRKGIRIRLSAARKMVLELLHHARKVPSLPLTKTMNVCELADARRTSGASWTAIFMRAYGLTAQAHPELRRAIIPWPWTHFYEHPVSECAVLVEREWQGERIILGAKLRAPESQSLSEIDAYLRHLRETPVWDVSPFRQTLRLGRLPWILRRFTFWQTLYLSGYKRAKRFGTFMMSSLGNMGVEQEHPLTPLTTYLTYGPISERGDVVVKIIYDHRVMDGRCVARCLKTLQQILQQRMVREVQQDLKRAA